MKLEVGKKYRLAHWDKGEWYKCLFIGKERWFYESQSGHQWLDSLTSYNYLPYEEPALDDTKLWYWNLKGEDGLWGIESQMRTEKDICNFDQEYRKLKALGFIEKEDS